MKTFIILSLILIVMPAFGSENAEVWKRMYNRASNIDQQYAIMQNIAALDDSGLIDLLDSALTDQISTMENYIARTERDSKNLLMRIIVNELSSLRAEESAEAIFTLYKTAEDHLLKADCLVALGQIRAVQFVPEINIILRNLNFNTSSNKSAAEIIAYAAIISLERMRDLRGFEQVLYASRGWYSRRVKEKAKAVLINISNDPTEPILEIISGNSDYNLVLIALEVGARSSAPKENKNKIADLSLREGLRYSSSDKNESQALSNLRLLAVNVMNLNSYKNPDIVDSLGANYNRSKDSNEKIATIQALGVNGTNEAVQWMSKELMNFSSKQISGNAANQNELLYIKQLINSLGQSGNINAKPILLEVQFSDFTPAIVRLAKEAILKLQ